MTILVTGGAGFIGSHLVRRLEADGEQVAILDNFSRGSSVGETSRDIANPFDVSLAFYGARAKYNEQISEVFHLAYINGTKTFYERPMDVMKVALHGMLNVLEACDGFNVKKFTLVSSSEVCRYAPVGSGEDMPLLIPDVYNPRYSYSMGKMASEMLAIHSKQFDKLTIVRPFNIYGPGMAPGHVIPDILAQFDKPENLINVELIGSGEETRSFCYIDDFIDGLMIARKHDGIFNIGVEQETPIVHLVELIASIKGKLCTVTSGKQLREGDLPRRRPDITKLRALGYEPKWTLWNGLTEMIKKKE